MDSFFYGFLSNKSREKSPEQGLPSTMTSEMFVRMTDKQTKPEGSPEAKGLQMKEAA